MPTAPHGLPRPLVGPSADSPVIDSQYLPHLRRYPVTRFLCRRAATLAKTRVLDFEGVEILRSLPDPFILVANHNHRLEAVLLPSLSVMARQGKMIHFMADWPMMLIPGIGTIYRNNQVIPVFSKNAKPPWLNRFKPFYERRYPGTAWQRAAAFLDAGKSIGVYPEGTMNRRPDELLAGRRTAARLALEKRVPILPMGARFPEVKGRRISDNDVMSLHVGEPMSPPPLDGAVDGEASPELIDDFHAQMMTTISKLCGKSWNPDGPR